MGKLFQNFQFCETCHQLFSAEPIEIDRYNSIFTSAANTFDNSLPKKLVIYLHSLRKSVAIAVNSSRSIRFSVR